MEGRSKILHSGFAVLLFFFITACSQTKLTGAWVDPAYDAGPVTKIMVVGMCENLFFRNTFEETMTEKFNEMGLTAVASVQCFTVGEELSDDYVLDELKRQQIDAVLVSEIIALQAHRHATSLSTFPRSTIPQNYAFGSRFYYDDKAEGIYETNVFKKNYFQEIHLYVHSKLFNSKTGKKIWQMQSETLNPEKDMDKAMDSIGNLIVKNMKKNDLI